MALAVCCDCAAGSALLFQSRCGERHGASGKVEKGPALPFPVAGPRSRPIQGVPGLGRLCAKRERRAGDRRLSGELVGLSALRSAALMGKKP